MCFFFSIFLLKFFIFFLFSEIFASFLLFLKANYQLKGKRGERVGIINICMKTLEGETLWVRKAWSQHHGIPTLNPFNVSPLCMAEIRKSRSRVTI